VVEAVGVGEPKCGYLALSGEDGRVGVGPEPHRRITVADEVADASHEPFSRWSPCLRINP